MEKEPPKNNRDPHKTDGKKGDLAHPNLLTSLATNINVPLSLIISSLEIFERTKDRLTPSKQDTLIDTALQESYRLNRLITNTFDLVKLENREVKVNKTSYMIEWLLEDCLTLLNKRISGCNITIKPSLESFPIITDRKLLMRAICIVVDNAAQHSPPNPAINIEYKRIDKQVIIDIKDNGPGINENRLEEIFTKQAELSMEDSNQAGNGLELIICREIMHLLGGTVKASNLSSGKGSVFTLAFAA